MTNYAPAFRAALEDLDVPAARRLWAHAMPGLPQPESDAEVLATLHHARTQAASLALRLRAWSHRWLLDHGLPSGLPDDLRPRAERMYPKVVSAVGIAVKPLTAAHRPLALAIRGAMEEAVMDAYATGRTEPEFVRARMREARAKILRQ